MGNVHPPYYPGYICYVYLLEHSLFEASCVFGVIRCPDGNNSACGVSRSQCLPPFVPLSCYPYIISWSFV